jgi:hypothetical protein
MSLVVPNVSAPFSPFLNFPFQKIMSSQFAAGALSGAMFGSVEAKGVDASLSERGHTRPEACRNGLSFVTMVGCCGTKPENKSRLKTAFVCTTAIMMDHSNPPQRKVVKSDVTEASSRRSSCQYG